jgi:hypothetical protein
MRKLWRKIVGFGVMAILLLPEIVAAGWEAWWTNLYNESHFFFTLLTVVLIPIVGLIFGTLADIIMGHIGIDLKSRELAEH